MIQFKLYRFRGYSRIRVSASLWLVCYARSSKENGVTALTLVRDWWGRLYTCSSRDGGRGNVRDETGPGSVLGNRAACTVCKGKYVIMVQQDRRKKYYINIITGCRVLHCGLFSSRSHFRGQFSRHLNWMAPFIRTFTVNAGKRPRSGASTENKIRPAVTIAFGTARTVCVCLWRDTETHTPPSWPVQVVKCGSKPGMTFQMKLT